MHMLGNNLPALHTVVQLSVVSWVKHTTAIAILNLQLCYRLVGRRAQDIYRHPGISIVVQACWMMSIE